MATKCGQRRLQNGREDNEAHRAGNTGEFGERGAGAKKNHGRTFPLPSIWCQICYPKAVCGRSFAGIAVSNHAEGMMFVCCVLCRYRPMHEADHCSVESYRVSVCACDLETSTA